jgi:DNA repair protein RadC
MTATKLIFHGAETLSDRELLSLALGNQIASDQLLTHYGSISKIPFNGNVTGLGKAKLIRLQAAMELAKRIRIEHAQDGKMNNSSNVFEILAPYFQGCQEERFLVLPLNAQNRLIHAPLTVSIGSLICTVVHPREVFSKLIQLKAVSTILAHNHPSSGDPTPSEEDIQLTQRLKTTGDVVGIKVLDHIIVGGESYYSFTDNNLF